MKGLKKNMNRKYTKCKNKRKRSLKIFLQCNFGNSLQVVQFKVCLELFDSFPSRLLKHEHRVFILYRE